MCSTLGWCTAKPFCARTLTTHQLSWWRGEAWGRWFGGRDGNGARLGIWLGHQVNTLNKGPQRVRMCYMYVRVFVCFDAQYPCVWLSTASEDIQDYNTNSHQCTNPTMPHMGGTGHPSLSNCIAANLIKWDEKQDFYTEIKEDKPVHFTWMNACDQGSRWT